MSRRVGRKSTGIFSDQEWGKNVQLNRESSLRPSRPTGLLVAEGLGEVIYAGLRVGQKGGGCEAEESMQQLGKLAGRRRITHCQST